MDEDRKETRLQGPKDQLAATENKETTEFRDGIDELKARIDELTEFKSGREFHTQAGGKS